MWKRTSRRLATTAGKTTRDREKRKKPSREIERTKHEKRSTCTYYASFHNGSIIANKPKSRSILGGANKLIIHQYKIVER